MPPKPAAGSTGKAPASKTAASSSSKAGASSASSPAKKSPAAGSAKSSVATKPAAGSKPGAKAASKSPASAKSGGKDNKEVKEPPAPLPEVVEENEYLETYELPSDPWGKFKSPYGGALTAAECFDKLNKETREGLTISGDELKAATEALDPPSASSAVRAARAVEAILATKGDVGDTVQRLVLSRCGLTALQMTPGVARRFVELDLSSNSLESVDRMAPHCLRRLDLAGNRLPRFPQLERPCPKLVSLNLSFNDLGGALPPRAVLEQLGGLRALGLQNCMLRSIAGEEGGGGVEALSNLVQLDLSFNLLADPQELLLLTSLQRLASLDVGCNEMCAVAEYEEKKSLMQRRIATLKTLNEQALVHSFGGYGENAVENSVNASVTANAISQDNSSCSCIEGNPCMSADNCADWNNRFSISHKVRMQKFWSQGRNFIDF